MNKGFWNVFPIIIMSLFLILFVFLLNSIESRNAEFYFLKESQTLTLLNGKAHCSIELYGRGKSIKWIIPEDEDICRIISIPERGKINVEFYKEGTYGITAQNNKFEKNCLITIAEVRNAE